MKTRHLWSIPTQFSWCPSSTNGAPQRTSDRCPSSVGVIDVVVCQASVEMSTRVPIDGIRTGDIDVAHKDASGVTFLHLACRQGDAELVSELCSLGAPLNALTVQHRSPLHEAIDSPECVRILLARGADVESFKHGDWTPLMTAATRGRLDVVDQLLDAGANVAHANRDGWNSLHLACREGHLSVVERLVSVSPETVHVSTRNGTTALTTAALHGHVDIVRLLLKCGASPTAADFSGCTPLMKAALGGHCKVLELLLSTLSSDDVTAVDGGGRSAAHYAAQGGSADCLIAIANNPAGHALLTLPDATSKWTPAHCAARDGRLPIIHALRSLGVPLDTPDKRGHIPTEIGAHQQKAASVC